MSVAHPRVLMLHMDPASSEALESALAARGAQAIVGTSWEPAVAHGDSPDVVLVDVDGAGRDAVRVASELSGAMPDSAVVLLASETDATVMRDVLLAGASGVLSRDLPPVALSRAVCGVVAGEAAVPRSLQPLLLEELRALGDDLT